SEPETVAPPVGQGRSGKGSHRAADQKKADKFSGKDWIPSQVIYVIKRDVRHQAEHNPSPDNDRAYDNEERPVSRFRASGFNLEGRACPGVGHSNGPAKQDDR